MSFIQIHFKLLPFLFFFSFCLFADELMLNSLSKNKRIQLSKMELEGIKKEVLLSEDNKSLVFTVNLKFNGSDEIYTERIQSVLIDSIKTGVENYSESSIFCRKVGLGVRELKTFKNSDGDSCKVSTCDINNIPNKRYINFNVQNDYELVLNREYNFLLKPIITCKHQIKNNQISSIPQGKVDFKNKCFNENDNSTFGIILAPNQNGCSLVDCSYDNSKRRFLELCPNTLVSEVSDMKSLYEKCSLNNDGEIHELNLTEGNCRLYTCAKQYSGQRTISKTDFNNSLFDKFKPSLYKVCSSENTFIPFYRDENEEKRVTELIKKFKEDFKDLRTLHSGKDFNTAVRVSSNSTVTSNLDLGDNDTGKPSYFRLTLNNTNNSPKIELEEKELKKCKNNDDTKIVSVDYEIDKEKRCMEFTCSDDLLSVLNRLNDKKISEEKDYKFSICYNIDVYERVNSKDEAKEKCKSPFKLTGDKVEETENKCTTYYCEFDLDVNILEYLAKGKLKVPPVIKVCKSFNKKDNGSISSSNNNPIQIKDSKYLNLPKPKMILKGKDSHRGRWNAISQ